MMDVKMDVRSGTNDTKIKEEIMDVTEDMDSMILNADNSKNNV